MESLSHTVRRVLELVAPESVRDVAARTATSLPRSNLGSGQTREDRVADLCRPSLNVRGSEPSCVVVVTQLDTQVQERMRQPDKYSITAAVAIFII